MKRFWLGVGILLILLGIGLGAGWFMNRFHDALSYELAAASRAASQGDWETAAAHTQKAQARWEQGKRTAAAFADHAPLEQVDNVFAQLRFYEQQKLTEEYAAMCIHLSELARALGESHSLTWWNLL